VENIETIDWTTLQIVETHDDEGRIELMSESQMCELLGIRDESAPIPPFLLMMSRGMTMRLVKMLMVLTFQLMMRCQVRW
jgi:hypothetical protein